MNPPFKKILPCLLVAICWNHLASCPLWSQENPNAIKRSRVVQRTGEHGVYHLYIPSKQPTRVLVISHGSPGQNESTTELSKKFIERWIRFAKRENLLLIAPAFDRENFGSDPNAGFGYGGYRGLFGRIIGADEYVIRLVDQFDDLCKIQDGRFLLYGHSAGGQFSIRFAVRHPSRVAALVASAPGRFSYPSLDASWPYGMGEFKRTIRWDSQTEAELHVTPDVETWEEAASLPITVVYGENDTERQPDRPAHMGNTRISFARGWVDAMNELQPESMEPSVSLILVPEIGHSSSRLTIPCQQVLRKLEWVAPSPLQVFRKWTSKNGKFSVTAIYVSHSEDEVELRKSDGTLLKVAKDKLGGEDVALLEKEVRPMETTVKN